MTWNDIKYEIADKLFARELDEAYNAGIRIGAEYATKKISFRLRAAKESTKLTKTQEVGYAKALEMVQEVKPEITRQTGAML